MSEYTEFLSLIDGKLVREGVMLPVINPATEQVAAQTPVVGPDMLEKAVESAKAAFEEWRHEQWSVRSKLLLAIAGVIRENDTELARLITVEQGKPTSEAEAEVDYCVSLLEYYSDKELQPEFFEKKGGKHVERFFAPLGVVGGIVPWNFPLYISIMKLAPAILTGNSIIVKPAPTTPLSTLHFGRLVKDVVPKGLLQILGDDGSLGPLMVEHPGIAAISFTGSTVTGKKIMESSASTMKRLNLELGGDDAAIVFEDVNPDAVAESIFNGAFYCCGQVCTAIKRLYVHKSIHDALASRLASLADKAVVGDGLEPGVTIGPVQNKIQYDKLGVYLEQARKSGNVLAGGEIVQGKGYFIRPTIVTGMDDEAPLVTQEQFGPILPILSFDDEDDVVRRANSLPYGLAGSVWSSDLERARRVARRMDTGTVWINKHLDLNHEYPMSPCKESGIGVEYGMASLEKYTQPRLINQ